MITQQEFVEGCQRYYAENYYEPGNPEDGEWHDCHYPTPGCLGGTETVKLLKEHHAVQGVLQSEEFNHPCIWGWEKHYLTDELLALFMKWLTIKARTGAVTTNKSYTTEKRSAAGRLGQSRRTPEQRSEQARKANAARTPEQLAETIRKVNAALTPEQRIEAARKANAALTPEKRSAAAELAHSRRTPEQRRAIALKAWETKRRKQQGG